MVTTDLSNFGYREIEEMNLLLKTKTEHGLPEDFYDNDVSIAFNTLSGFVFFTNSEYQVAMLNGDKLESFYNSPYDGIEGFFDEILGEYENMHAEDKEWFEQLNDDYYQEILPLELTNGDWIIEGEKYFVIDEDDCTIVETVLDADTDRDNEAFVDLITAAEYLNL